MVPQAVLINQQKQRGHGGITLGLHQAQRDVDSRQSDRPQRDLRETTGPPKLAWITRVSIGNI